MTTLIAIEVMVDFVTIGKPKLTRKSSPWMALIAVYGAKTQGYVSVLVDPMQASNFVQIRDGHFLCWFDME